MQNTEYQRKLFKNRLTKNFKHLSKWARRKAVFAYRIYDKDIPEIPVAVDFYCQCRCSEPSEHTSFTVLTLYKRPYEKPEHEERFWLSCMAAEAAEVTGVLQKNIIIKERKKQKGFEQYEKTGFSKNRIIVKEGVCLFYLNLTDYIDTGLFLDHRPSRLQVFKSAGGKRVLNLFSYTGAFSVHAAKGGAKSTVSVDLSNTYLKWAKDNFLLNGLSESERFSFVKSDVIVFLQDAVKRSLKWDLIICDPPTFSNSKSANMFDVKRDWLCLCLLCTEVLAENGVLYFSSNSLKLQFDAGLLAEKNAQKGVSVNIKDVSKASIPEDFRNKKIHRMWEIKKCFFRNGTKPV